MRRHRGRSIIGLIIACYVARRLSTTLADGDRARALKTLKAQTGTVFVFCVDSGRITATNGVESFAYVTDVFEASHRATMASIELQVTNAFRFMVWSNDMVQLFPVSHELCRSFEAERGAQAARRDALGTLEPRVRDVVEWTDFAYVFEP